MQLMKFHKSFGLALTLVLSSNLILNSTHADIIPSWCDTKKVAASTLFATVVISFVRLVTKETQPVRVEPVSDSNLDMAWYIFDELLVGQMEKGERPAKVIYNEDTEEFDIKYSKIKPRGVAGVIYSKMKPVIIPALSIMLLFNKDLKEKFIDSIIDTRKWVNNPSAPFIEIWHAITTGTKLP